MNHDDLTIVYFYFFINTGGMKMKPINTHFPNLKKERPYRPALVGPYTQPIVGP